MTKDQLKNLVFQVKNEELSIDDAVKKINDIEMFGNFSFATIDNKREERVGYPEIIYGEGKTSEQVVELCQYMTQNNQNILVSRASKEMFEAVKNACSKAYYNDVGRTIVIANDTLTITKSKIVIVSAGTSDLPVVEEAYETAKALGNRVEKIIDVGVAGIHRLFHRLDQIREAKVVIVIAGMEGALASVVGGLVDKPVIAVPTSVGYGANMNGLSALLCMLNSCASGVSVVNIDNGFGAAYTASIINHL